MLTARVGALAAVAVGVGCGSDHTAELSPAQREVRDTVQGAVDAANRGDTGAWCRSLYFVAAPASGEAKFADPEQTTAFESAPSQLRRSCLGRENRHALRKAGNLKGLEFRTIDIDRDKATVHLVAQRAGQTVRDKMLLRKLDGRWLIQYRLQ